jgi:hypothetical protein
MKKHLTVALVTLAVGASGIAGAANAATNLLTNGSFETGNFSGWTQTGTTGDAFPEVVIPYNSIAGYPGGAFSEPVPPATGSLGPDPAGDFAAYFVSDFADETLSQTVHLDPGTYTIGFSAYAPANGEANMGDAQFSGSIAGVNLVNTTVSAIPGTTWENFTGVAHIATAGDYTTDFTFITNHDPSKDVVIDQAFIVQGLVGGVPEPATWALMLVGVGLMGGALRLSRQPARIRAAA